MFLIFVLSHPQHIGDFSYYSCKMDVEVPRCHLQADVPMSSTDEVVFPPVYLFITEENLSQMLPADFYPGPICQDWFTSPCPD